jgi:hypothetical protein
MEPALPEQSKNVRINGTTQIRGSMETSEAPSFQHAVWRTLLKRLVENKVEWKL